MCLSAIGLVTMEPTKEEVWGWKVFLKEDGRLYSDIVGGHRPRGRWLRASGKNWPEYRSYGFGWHAFVTRAEARRWGLAPIRVRLRGVVARGTQIGPGYVALRAIVAREMYIP